jgi:opacity protein-like surface antigen
MNKKIFAMLLITALFGITKLHAQLYVGIEAGANRNWLVSNTKDKPFFEYEPSNGFSAGMSIRYEFPKLSWFGGIQASPSYVQRNYRMQRTGYYEPMYQQSTNGYLELPIMAQFRFGGKLNKAQSLYGTLNLGGYGAYWMTGNVEGRALSPMDPANYQSYDEAYTFSDEKDRRFQFGGLVGIGLQYMPNKKYVVSIEGRYTPSLTDMQKAYSENQVPRYNDTYSLLVGVQYKLSELKLGKGKSAKQKTN